VLFVKLLNFVEQGFSLSTNYIIRVTLDTEFNTQWFSPVFAKNHRLDPNLIHPGKNLFSWWVLLCPLEVDMCSPPVPSEQGPKFGV